MMVYNAKLLAKALGIARMKLAIANMSSEVRNALITTERELNLWRLTAITSICINVVLLAFTIILTLKLRKR